MSEAVKVYAKNYIPGSQSFADGFLGPKGDVGFFMALDRPKARSIIATLLSAGRNIERAEVGLDGDWRQNSAEIYPNDESDDIYPGSIWATPLLLVFFTDSPDEAYEVWSEEEK